MIYTSPEKYLPDLKAKLEEVLMDLAELKQMATKNDHYPIASKFRDIEHLTLKYMDRLDAIEQSWL